MLTRFWLWLTTSPAPPEDFDCICVGLHFPFIVYVKKQEPTDAKHSNGADL